MRLFGIGLDRFVGDAGNLPYSPLNALGVREAVIRTLAERVEGARLVFTISPGRSGSGFLAALLDSAANAEAAHEPRPRMTGAFLRGLSSARLTESYDRRRIKLVQILRRLAALPPGFTYAETSHMFVKTFHDVVLDHFAGVRVVHLRRELPRVIRSFAELGYFSDATSHWRHWMHDPYRSEPLVPPAVDEAEADSFDRIIAYLIDVEARAAELRYRRPDVQIETVRVEELEDPVNARRLFDRLELEWTEASTTACAQRSNRRAEMKRAVGRSVDLGYCEERLERYVERAAAGGIALPRTMLQPEPARTR